MVDKNRSVKLGKEDAKIFISEERIEYNPFVAMSDMHMVRKTFEVSYDALQETVEKRDPDLWREIDSSAEAHQKESTQSFSFDEYAQGFVEGVAAVWEQIKDKV